MEDQAALRTDLGPSEEVDDLAGKSEEELLEAAIHYSFRARLEKRPTKGPIFEWARGSLVRDINGKIYIDFNAGQMCSALGHNHPRIVEAIQKGLETHMHASSSYYNVEEIELLERLAQLLPPPLEKSFFLLSGSDANEAALAVARRYTGGYEIISPHVSFHGLADASRAVTYSSDWRKGFGPYAPGAYAMFAPYCYRCPLKLTYPDCGIACLDASFELIDAESDGRLAAVITEPLFSAGGVIEPPHGWLSRLHEMCRERGMLLVLDEEQTGLAKLGSMWACQLENVVPDILTIAKHFGGGISISAVSTTSEIEARATEKPFLHGHSHSSDPLACRAGIASLEIIVEEDLVERAQRIGKTLREILVNLQEKYECIGDIRGRGLIQGIELVADRKSKIPNYERGRVVARYCEDAGLLFSVRRGGSVLRFVPPFTTTEEQFSQAAEILDRAFKVTEQL